MQNTSVKSWLWTNLGNKTRPHWTIHIFHTNNEQSATSWRLATSWSHIKMLLSKF